MENIENQNISTSTTPDRVIDQKRLKEVFGDDIDEGEVLYGWMKLVEAGTAKVVEEPGGGVGIYDQDGGQVYLNGNPEATVELLNEFYEEYSSRYTSPKSRMDH